MTVAEYREVLHEDIALSASANIANVKDEFIGYVTKILINGEEFDDFVDCYYEGISRRKANMRIDGYSMDDSDGSCCVFISDYRGPHESDSIFADEINACFKKIRYFVDEAVKYELYQELEESTEAYEFARSLHYEIDRITKFRFFLLTDAYNKQRAKTIKDESVSDKTVELNVWDINRLFAVVSSKAQKESVEIDFADLDIDGIPCVKAVDCVDVVADIEMSPKYDSDISDEIVDEKPENIITYSSYLAVVPGQLLNDLYLEYGSRLLEGNVRSFLTVRKKVNKGIQNTIKNYPEMFFAYNNGIAATATEIDTNMTSTGLKITRIKDLQIVNGGQTTASIANTLLTARKDETIDISGLFVPMKISVLEHSMSEKIIPKIAEYSNSQTKVEDSDFFSNHPFHIRMEGYSRRILAPAVKGNQYQQYWYYERTRGQYNQGKMKFKPKSSQFKQYETKYPENQVITMVDLAKYMVVYYGRPDIASKGKQKIVESFSKAIKEQWAKSDIVFNDLYYRRVVSLAIIFKSTDSLIKKSDWYKQKHSYKANVIAYSMSLLFAIINEKCRGCILDFQRIWNKQEIYPELIQQMDLLCKEVYDFITRDDRLTENVTQWCKQEECWRRAKSHSWTILPEFTETLVASEEIQSSEKDAAESRKVANEVDNIKFIISAGSAYWQKVYNWGISRKLLTDVEQSILKIAVNIETTGRIPSDKQAKVVLRTRDKLIQEGMPLQF